MKEFIPLLEADIKRFQFSGHPRSLYEPIHYIMGLGGKRMRPMLAVLAYRLYRVDVESMLRYATAVEAFHNFTLVHDDIMDKAPLRRGKATVHEKWDVNTAILSGDVMLVKVYDQFLSLEPAKLKEVLALFNACAAGVCEGQQWDMEFESLSRVTETQYIEMIRLKTAVLLGFSLELGALLADAPAGDRRLLRQFGEDLGVAFQLKDDLLDVYADKKKFGKQTGGDILANKKTFLLIQALKRARGPQAKELSRWLSAKKFDTRKKVAAVTAIYDQLGVREITEERIRTYIRKAYQSLDQLSVKDTTALRSLVDSLAAREK
ncbi:MAG: polyprenyl synthetase family protein [Cyclobacteriaceae bacterium]|nr:polyprenyl synthetase family protein [Cyclobacteriaceae bacterium]